MSPESQNSLTFLLFSNPFTSSKLIRAFILKHCFVFASFCTVTSLYIFAIFSLKPTSKTNTHSFYVVTLRRSTAPSRFHLNDRSFTYCARKLWNSFPKYFRQPAARSTTTDFNLPISSLCFSISF